MPLAGSHYGADRPELSGRFAAGLLAQDWTAELWAYADLFVAAEAGCNQLYDHALGDTGTRAGAPVAAVDDVLGPVLSFPGGAAAHVEFAARAQYASGDLTLGCMFRIATGATLQGLIHANPSAGSPTGVDLVVLANDMVALNKNNTANINGPTLTAGVPYFLVTSYKAATGATKFVLKRLDTGLVTVTTPAADTQAWSSGLGTIRIGAYVGGASEASFTGGVAMAYAARRWFSDDVLQRWVEDPWAPLREAEIDALGPRATVAGGGGAPALTALEGLRRNVGRMIR